ncbi:unnamed protein product [Mytilus coruscus]|uniref:Uncharacterized protein n=1 Tax=Mytilus coruscus TaxID=42192 RepID=A0A6J8EZS2_MYTCO|nr:unnamed protein product [Mytilus coruscus]
MKSYYLWDDCTVLSSTFHKRKDETYNNHELCYLVKKDTLEWESKHCGDDHYFACEKKISGACNHSTILSSNKEAKYDNITTSECQTKCAESPNCWSGISIDLNLCILLQSRTGSESLSQVTMFKKSCVQVNVVVGDDVPSSAGNKGETPLLNCSYVSQTDIPEVSDSAFVVTDVPEHLDSTLFVTDIPEDSDSILVVTDISPTPCYMYETFNITNIYHITEFITQNITETVNVTETVYANNTMIETSIPVLNLTGIVNHNSNMIETVTSTINVTATICLTNVYNINENQGITSTVYSQCPNVCLNASQPYLSPDDPVLLEAIASMSKEMKVDKKKTNSHIRKLTSASDSRMSSRTIGIFGVILLIIPFILIILGDMPAIWRDIRTFFRRCRKQDSHKP